MHTFIHIVSVPFRGLGSEKLAIFISWLKLIGLPVSVPFRGLGSEKHSISLNEDGVTYTGFRPLSGIRF